MRGVWKEGAWDRMKQAIDRNELSTTLRYRNLIQDLIIYADSQNKTLKIIDLGEGVKKVVSMQLNEGIRKAVNIPLSEVICPFCKKPIHEL